MGFFVTAEQRQRSLQYEAYVDNGNEALDLLEADQRLAHMGVPQMRQLLNESVLPNVRHGLVTVPLAHVLKDSLAMLPLPGEAMSTITPSIMRNPLNWHATVSEPLLSHYFSQRYGMEVDLVDSVTVPAQSYGSDPDTEGERIEPQARTGVFGRISRRGYTFKRGRPWMLLDHDQLGNDPQSMGAIVVHELVHVQDFVDEGQAHYFSDELGACSEFRAYRTGVSISRASGYRDSFAESINTRRMRVHGNKEIYRTTPELTRYLVSRGAM